MELLSSPASRPHPLQPLSKDELLEACEVLIKSYDAKATLFFRAVYLDEPKKTDLLKFLAAEHKNGNSGSDVVPQIPRRVKLIYDVCDEPGKHRLTAAVVELGLTEKGSVGQGKVVQLQEHSSNSQFGYVAQEYKAFQEACVASDLFKEALKEFEIPDNFTICIDPWPYGGLEQGESAPRYMQGLVFARNVSNKNQDSNHYAYPIPIIPVMDFVRRTLIRIDRLATGGMGDPLDPQKIAEKPRKLFARNQSAEYVPELLDIPLRADLKPLNIIQPDGASFTVQDSSLVQWQKWRFRVGFTPREGAILHDICYENRPIMFRLSFSEMTVPYGDPRPNFHRKQAFDFGDGGMGRAANSLDLGCDCLGVIHYLDAWVTDTSGQPTLAKNVVCIHEQDNGIGWKHTNFRTGRPVVARQRELVVQFIATLANYEYIFAYKLDTAGGITVETRATGIVSVVAIDDDKTSAYGNVVSPGALAQNHQHIFALRIDPAMDSYDEGATAIVLEESHPIPLNPETNPYGNGYEIRRDRINRAMCADAMPRLNRTVRMESTSQKNKVSGKYTGYKFISPATQLLLADPKSTVAKRASFAQHHLWVTGHRDDELWAAGEFTNQSVEELGGVKTMVERGDWFGDRKPAEDANSPEVTNGENDIANMKDEEGRLSMPVVWSVFGMTHNPRTEDWPVMPIEVHQLHIKPADFFSRNPALDMPSMKNETSVLSSTSLKSGPCCEERSATGDPVAHLQGLELGDSLGSPMHGSTGDGERRA